MLVELARGISLAESGSPFSIIIQWYLPDLFQQGGFAFHLLEDLRQSKASEFLGGFTSADALLSTAQSLKKSGGKRFKDRFCGSGIRWSNIGAEHLLPILDAIMSRRFDKRWQSAYNPPQN